MVLIAWDSSRKINSSERGPFKRPADSTWNETKGPNRNRYFWSLKEPNATLASEMHIKMLFTTGNSLSKKLWNAEQSSPRRNIERCFWRWEHKQGKNEPRITETSFWFFLYDFYMFLLLKGIFTKQSGKNLRAHVATAARPCAEHLPLGQATPCHTQPSPEHCQGLDIHSSPGQPEPEPQHLQRKEVLPNTQSKSIIFVLSLCSW